MQLIIQKRGYRILPMIALVVALALLALTARDSSAVHNEGMLEMDGNVAYDTGGLGFDPGTTNCPYNANTSTNAVDCISTGATFDWADVCDRTSSGALAGYITEAASLPSLPAGKSIDDLICQQDFVIGATDDISYHSGSDKDFQEIGGSGPAFWHCQTSANATSKADILNTYFIVASVTEGGEDHQIVYIGAERDSEHGSVFNGYWILQADVSVPGAATTAGQTDCTPGAPLDFSGQHVCGDVLIRFNYTSGGRIGGVRANEWIAPSPGIVYTPAFDAAKGCDQIAGTGDDCTAAQQASADTHTVPGGFLCDRPPAQGDCRSAVDQTAPGDDLCGRVNGTTTCTIAPKNNDPNPPPCSGPGSFTTEWEPSDGSPASATVAPPTFSEMGVDLTGLGLELPCIATLITESRSSPAIDATLKDFAPAPTGESCTSGLTTEVHDADHNAITSIEAGTTVHDSATLAITGPSGATAGGTLSVERFDNIDCSGDPVATDTVTVSQSPGTQTYEDLLPVTTASGTSISYLVSYSGDPPLFPGAAFHCEPLQVVDAQIDISPSAVNEVGVCHTFTVTVQQDDGLASGATGGDGTTGFADVAGLNPTVTFTDANGAVSTSCGEAADNTCASTGTDASGNCTASIVSDTAGTVTAHASITFTVGGVSLTRETDGTGNNSGDAVKRFVDAQIDIGDSAVNEVGVCHTFTVTVLQDDGLSAAQGGDGADSFAGVAGLNPTVTFTDANGAVNTSCGTAAQNTCGTTGTDSFGNCTASIVSNTAGTVTAHASITFSVGGVSLTRATDGTGNNSSDAVKRFVDAQIDIGPSAVNEVGVCHTFTVTIQQDDGLSAAQGGDGVSGFAAVAGLNPTVTFTDANGADSKGCGTAAQNTCGTTGTDASGNCTASIVSDTAGTVTAHASITFSVGGVSLTRETDGSGNNSGDAVKRFVDAYIVLSPLTDTNPIFDVHTITATVQQDDGLSAAQGGDGVSGFGPAPDGTLVCFSLNDNTANAVFTGSDAADETCDGDADPLNDCAISGGLGTCTIQITAATAGSVDIHATTTFSVGGVSLTRETDGQGNNSPDANKIFESAAIKIRKLSTKQVLGENKLVNNPGALFEVDGPDADTDPDFTVRDNNTGTPPGTKNDEDSTVGVVCVSGLVPGSYTITETAPPTGYALPTVVADRTKSTSAAGGSTCASGAGTVSFIDPPLFDLEINFRDGGSGETSATIDCEDANGALTPDETDPPTGSSSGSWETTDRYLRRVAPTVITCTINVDP